MYDLGKVTWPETYYKATQVMQVESVYCVKPFKINVKAKAKLILPLQPVFILLRMSTPLKASFIFSAFI